MKKQLFALATAFFAILVNLRADTSYLLIQGPFGPDDAEETFKWQVNYPAGDLQDGQDLLNAVFGTPSFNGSYYTDLYGNSYQFRTAGSSAQADGFVYYPQYGGLYLASITLDSTTLLQDPSYSPGWNYYVAGGGSNYGAGYANGTWTYSNDGLASRSLTFPDNNSDSFDAWVFGSTDDPPAVAGDDNDPTAADFAGATVINVVPEPSGIVLAALGIAGLLARHWKRRVRRLSPA